ncbi:MAG: hypothetical protein QOF57_2710 [Frankiaceae bacterium]|jgi:Flp pilus assembly protein TadG|nr:hypothetical protein [Frankiaceae bacterium]
MSLRRRLLRDDSGAVAVIVSIMAVVLFAFGALAIDLGNGFARKRSTQTDADFAALAGGTKLPDTAAARQVAWDYLTRNLPQSDGNPAIPPLADFSDGDLTNGEICFPAADDPYDAPLSGPGGQTCANGSTTRIKVIVPKRHVDFGLGKAVGVNSVDVWATASVALRSPAGVILPFALPTTCSSGQQVIKDPAPGQASSPQWEGSSGPNRPVISALSLPPAAAVNGVTGVVVPANQTVAVTITATHIRSTTKAALITTASPIVLAPTPVPANGAASLTITVPALPDGRYYVQVGQGNNAWSDNLTTVYVDVGSGPNVCDAATGDFGLVDSPRLDVTNGSLSQALFLNLVKGGDHGIVQWGVAPPIGTPCRTGSTVLAGGVLDDDPHKNNVNCLDVATGNQVDQTTDGLIAGQGNVAGRLVTGPTTPCARSNVTVLGKSINNDVLSCFLQGGHTLAQLNGAGAVPNILRCEIYKSPRFMYVPVYDTSVNPQNGWWPIRSWVGAFMTDETPFAAASSTNGIVTNNTKIISLTSYAFPLTALNGCGNQGPTTTYVGSGPGIPVLVN